MLYLKAVLNLFLLSKNTYKYLKIKHFVDKELFKKFWSWSRLR